MSEAKPTVLYLHGFASSPASYKGQRFDAYLTPEGYRVERLDLRLPDRDHLRVSTMIDHVAEASRSHGGVVLIGSSLGGLVAAHAGAKRANVIGALLMAPAFGFAARWAASLGDEQLGRWRGGEPLEVEDHAGGPPLQLDYGFFEDASAMDSTFPQLVCPTLIFHGSHDEVVDVRGSRSFAEQACDARLVELDDGHTLVDSLDQMLPEALRFLESLSRGAPSPPWRTHP